MNVREAANNRNAQGGFFMTAPETRESQMNVNMPRTGGSAFRKNMNPLLSPGTQRINGLHNSQAFSPMNNNHEYVSPLDVQKEKEKITRFLHTKERST